MRFRLSWLNSYLEDPVTAKQACAALTGSGVEIESVATGLDKNIVVAQATSVKPHPNADRLQLVGVTDGSKDSEIVCGATNVKPGMKVVLARVGAVLPDGTEIKASEIRGVKSHGMLCSPAELGWSDDHSGIVELDSKAKLGQPLGAGEGEVIDVTTPANRADLLSVIGLAREVAAHTQQELKLPESETAEAKTGKLIGSVEGTNRYLLYQLDLPKQLADTPPWMQQRLMASGLRPINLVVDITNYVMLEWGQPLHAFNAKALQLPLSVQSAVKVEKVTTLDGQERQVGKPDLLICDRRGPVALAGVMGLKNTEFSPGDQSVILEAASFDAVTIRRMALRHGLRTEASARFERALPVQLAPVAGLRAVNLLIELAGAKLVAQQDELKVWPWVQHIGLRISRVAELASKTITPPEIAERLRALGFTAEKFDIVDEAKKHVGKPYKFGASFKTDGVKAFDCSYLTDYIYSLIGQPIGHTAAEQFKKGEAVGVAELQPGDLLFRDGPWHDLDPKERGGISHCALYIGEGRIVDARDYRKVANKWEKLTAGKQQVTLGAAKDIIELPEFKGARRYVEDLHDYIAVTVPWWRPDVRLEADAAEEVIKLGGYDDIPVRLPAWQPYDVEADRYWPAVWRFKELWRSLGWFEVTTYSFLSEQLLAVLGRDPLKHQKLKNPLSQEQAYLRSDLLPSLLVAVANNEKHSKQFGLFELSRVFDAKGEENEHLAAIVRGEADRAYLKAKAALDLVAAELGRPLLVEPKTIKGLHRHKSATVKLGGRVIGTIGEVNPAALHNYKIGGALGYIELDFGSLMAAITPKTYQTISRFPLSRRDVALIVKDDVQWQVVAAALDEMELLGYEFVSSWSGDDIKAGHKSLALRLLIGSHTKTLTDAEVEDQVGRVVKALRQRFKAEIR
jgi:phenylalanyl-tRNA synthetase beta subunit